MSSPTLKMLGLTPEKVREMAKRQGVKMPEPLSADEVDKLVRRKAAECTKRSMQKKRGKETNEAM